jgi:hypothetical protein
VRKPGRLRTPRGGGPGFPDPTAPAARSRHTGSLRLQAVNGPVARGLEGKDGTGALLRLCIMRSMALRAGNVQSPHHRICGPLRRALRNFAPERHGGLAHG